MLANPTGKLLGDKDGAIVFKRVRQGDARTVLERWQPGNVTLVAILLIAVSMWLVWVPNKELWFDEFLSLYTASAPDVASVLQIQQRSPVSLDPPGYHVITHSFIRLLGPTAFAVRLPSLLGWLIMLLCLFLFCRRLIGPEFAGFTVALTLPTVAFSYAAEARPYGLLLGLATFGLLCWQRAVCNRNSRWAPVGLALALWIALLLHYLAVLLLIPFALGEFVSLLRTKSIHWPISAALVSTVIPIATWLPFLRGADSYRAHIYTHVHLSQLAYTYAFLFAPRLHGRFVPLVELSVIVATALGVFALFRRYGVRRVPLEWVPVVGFALLPLFGILFSFVTNGWFAERYALAALLGITPLCVLPVQALLRRRQIFLVALSAVMLAGCGMASVYAIHDSRHLLGLRETHIEAAPNVHQELFRLPLVVANVEQYLKFHYYTPLGPKLLFVADVDREIRWLGHDTLDRSAINLSHFAPIHVVGFCEFISSNKRFLFADQPDFDEWLPQQLLVDGSQSQRIGSLGTAQLYLVTASDTTVREACQ